MDVAQDVFIYIRGNSIQPSGSFQQATRCRNIKTLYFYGETDEHEAQYESLEDVKDAFKQNIITSKAITNLSTCLDENDNDKLIENSFFNLYCYNEYVKDIFHTDKEKHFENILKNNGFIVTSLGTPVKLDKETNDEMKSIVEQHNDEMFDEFLDAPERDLIKFDIFNKAITLLGLLEADRATLMHYKDIITNKYKLVEHLNIIRLMKDEMYIDAKLNQVYENGFDAKSINNIYNKIKLLRSIEATYDIKPLDVVTDRKGDIEMTDEMFTLFKSLFRTQKKKPTTFKELKQLYVGIIKHIASNDIISSKQDGKSKDGKRKEYSYSLDETLIKYHLELNKYINKNGKHFHSGFVERFGIDVKHTEICESDEECNFLDM